MHDLEAFAAFENSGENFKISDFGALNDKNSLGMKKRSPNH